MQPVYIRDRCQTKHIALATTVFSGALFPLLMSVQFTVGLVCGLSAVLGCARGATQV
jgi:hypothetical protein